MAADNFSKGGDFFWCWLCILFPVISYYSRYRAAKDEFGFIQRQFAGEVSVEVLNNLNMGGNIISSCNPYFESADTVMYTEDIKKLVRTIETLEQINENIKMKLHKKL